MKLLDKKDIQVQKSTERKKEVEEGMKLAKSVDSLRETHTKEQIKLKQFRDATLKNIKSEVDVLIQQKNAAIAEIIVLEQRRREVLAPIDLTNEWKLVEKIKEDLSQRETSLINREILVQDVDKRNKVLKEKEKEAQSYFDKARSTYIKTEDILNDVENRKKESDKIIKERSDELNGKEKELIDRELIIKQQIEQVSKDKNEILIKNTDLIERESSVEAKLKEFIKRESNVKELELLTKRYNDETVRNYEKSEQLKGEIETLKKKVDIEISDKLSQLLDREKQIGYRERDLVSERENIENQKKDIEKEKIHITSQQQTLKVAWDNIKKLQAKK